MLVSGLGGAANAVHLKHFRQDVRNFVSLYIFGGTSHTAVVRASGGQSQYVSLVTVGIAPATMLLLAALLGLLPNATLARMRRYIPVLTSSEPVKQCEEFAAFIRFYAPKDQDDESRVLRETIGKGRGHGSQEAW